MIGSKTFIAFTYSIIIKEKKNNYLLIQHSKLSRVYHLSNTKLITHV